MVDLLVLHPRYKLHYFEKLAWDPEWIMTAKEIVKDEFKHPYSNYIINKPSAPSRSSAKVIISYHI
jgi:hypothetical protein